MKLYKIDTLDEYSITLMLLVFLSMNNTANARLKNKVCRFVNKIDFNNYTDNPWMDCHINLLLLFVYEYEKGVSSFSLESLKSTASQDEDQGDDFSNFFYNYHNGLLKVDGRDFPSDLSDEDITWLENFIETELQYIFIHDYTDNFHDTSEALEEAYYEEGKKAFVLKTIKWAESFLKEAKEAEAISGFRSHDFITDSYTFMDSLKQTHKRRTTPQSFIKSGLQMLNETLGGGFQSSRVYTILGRSGDWKSGLLLNIALWACNPIYNPKFIMKDPTRRPCVLYLTQENDRDETIERMFSYYKGVQTNIKDISINDFQEFMQETFKNEEDRCHFAFYFRPDRSITTDDLNQMINNLYLEGYEVVMVIQDYIKRIRPMETFKEYRYVELGQVVNEFSIISKEHQVPVITAMQLNRDAYMKVQNAQDNNRMDFLDRIGAANIGESLNIYENSDVVLLSGRNSPSVAEGKSFLEIRRKKMRGRSPSPLIKFAYPFLMDGDLVNEMRLVEDAHLTRDECKGILNLADNLADTYKPPSTMGNAPSTQNRNRSPMPSMISSDHRDEILDSLED